MRALFALLFTLSCSTPDDVPLDAGGTRDAGIVPDAGVAEDGGVVADAGLIDQLTYGPCDPTELPPGYTIPADLECAVVEVPVDRALPSGGTIALRVAVHRALGSSRGAIFQLAGGPGGSAVAQAGIIPRVMPLLRNDFDLVYVDQRGTGASGYLHCPDTTLAGLRACASSFAGIDLDHYLSRDAADDIDDVRHLMGYERIMIRGGSYGTRVGLEYARRHPERALAMVLDGLVLPEDDFFTSVLTKGDRGVVRLIEDCALDPACSAIAPELEQDLRFLLDQSKTAPRPISVDGQAAMEDEWLFRYALTHLVEDWYFRFRLPRAVGEAAGGDYRAWDAMLSELFGLSITSDQTGMQASYVAIGLYLTVVCAEFFPNVSEDLESIAAAQTWGDSSILEIASLCPEWPVSPISSEERMPVVSDVPTLLMSGAIDFVTPPEGGDIAARTLSRGLHVIVPDATHATMITTCGADIITQFFQAEGDLSSLDLSCLDTYEIEFE